MSFLFFGLNFSLCCQARSNFSLLAWISHFYGAHTPISHFGLELLTCCHFSSEILTFPANFSLFQPAPLTRRPSQWHGYYHVIGMFWQAGARRQITARHAGMQKVRNSECRLCEKWEIQSVKWEIRAIAQEKWEIWAQTEKFARWQNPKWEIRALSETLLR